MISPPLRIFSINPPSRPRLLLPRLPLFPPPLLPPYRWQLSTLHLTGSNPGRLIAAAGSLLSAVSLRLTVAGTPCLALLQATISASIISTLAARLAVASPPALGRETSNGPGGSTLLCCPSRGPSSSPHQRHQPGQLPGRQRCCHQPAATPLAAAAVRTAYC